MKFIKICISTLMTALLLQSCLFRPEPIRAQCNPVGDSIDLGRISFTMKFDPNWHYSWKPETEIISVHYLQQGLSSAVNVASYTHIYNNVDINWDNLEDIKNYIRDYRIVPRNEGLKRHNPFGEVNIVKVGDLFCVRYVDITNMAELPNYDRSNGGYDESLDYFCPVPSQPRYLPIIVGMSQSVGYGLQPLDLDEYLIPILETIVINPNPPENPAAIPSRIRKPGQIVINRSPFQEWLHSRGD